MGIVTVEKMIEKTYKYIIPKPNEFLQLHREEFLKTTFPNWSSTSDVKWAKLVLCLVAIVIAFACFILCLVPINYTEDIVRGTVTVNAGSYRYYQFTVPSCAINIWVEVFVLSVSGGGGNDIMVYVMDSTNFVNWQNGRGASAIYSSGQGTRDFIGGALPPGGTYYLVIDNSFSITSQKNVITEATLDYEQARF